MSSPPMHYTTVMTFDANTQILTFARAYLKKFRAIEAEYDADVADWYDNGDGRSVADGGRGHTYPVCIHGVSRWVDYDCACWQCEAGQRPTREAVVQAFATCTTLNERYAFMSTIPSDLPRDIRNDIARWALEPYSALA